MQPEAFNTRANAQSLKEEGNALVQQGNYQAALAKYNFAIVADPNFAPAWFNKGLMHKRLNQKKEALQAFDTTLRLDDSYDKAMYQQGLLLKEENQLLAAWKKFKAFSTKNPTHIETLLGAFNCEQKIGARVIFAKVDLKLTKDGKIKILEFGRGMQSSFKNWEQAVGEPVLDTLKKKAQLLKLPEIIVDPLSDSAPTVLNVDELLHAMRLQSLSTVAFSPEQLKHYRYLYISMAARPGMPERVLGVDDTSTRLIFEDKILMHESFVQTKCEDIRPKTLILTREFTTTLAQHIRRQCPGVNYFVFKTPNEEGGRGVLVISDKTLEPTIEVLALLTETMRRAQQKNVLLEKPLPKLSDVAIKILQERQAELLTWLSNTRLSFMVEEYVTSKPLVEQHQYYDATFSTTCLIIRDNATVRIESIASCWVLPPQPVSYQGNIRDKTVACLTSSHNKVKAVSAEDQQIVYEQLNSKLPLVIGHILDRDMAAEIEKLPTRHFNEKKEQFYLWLHFSNALAHHGHHEIAMHYLQRAEALSIDAARLHHEKGVLQHLKGDYLLAIESYNLALSLSPKNTGTYYRRGKSWLALNQPEKAEQDFEQCLKIDNQFEEKIKMVRIGNLLRTEIKSKKQ